MNCLKDQVMVWKRKIFYSAIFSGGCYILSSNNMLYKHLEERVLHCCRTSSKSEDFSYLHPPENSGNSFYEAIEPGWFSWKQHSSPIYWKLLMLSKSKNPIVRHKAVKSLSEIPKLEDWEYLMIAQACDPRTAIGLARMPNCNASFFVSSPFRDLKEVNITRELMNFLTSLPTTDTDPCIGLLTSQAKIYAKYLENSEKLDSEAEDSESIYHSQKKIVTACIFHKICLKLFLEHSTLESRRSEMVKKGMLKLLWYILKYHENDTVFQSLIAQILGNFALDEKFANSFCTSGWIGILGSWSKSSCIQVNLPAAKALANLDRDDFHHALYDNGVYLLHPQLRQRQKEYHADIIFIHGLLGATFWTWRQNDNRKSFDSVSGDVTDNSSISKHVLNGGSGSNFLDYTFCWPKDWLASDFPELRLLSVDYNTCISNWGTDCPQHEERDTLSAKAKNVINKLVLADVGRKPIIWVAHSMGGLIVKQILVHAAASLVEDKKSIIENTIGVIFFSVPHIGSELANIFQSAALVFQPSVDISQLRKGCPNLLSLHEKFKDIVSRNGVSVLSFAESKKTRWGLTLTMLVEEDSSNPGFGEYYVLPVDHLNTCKPETRDSFTYTKILQFFQTIIPTHVSATSSVLREVVELSNVMGLIP